MNTVSLMGRLVRDPERRDNGPVRFTVAVDRKIKDKDGNRPTDFIPCTAWGKVGELIERDFRKGRPILVGGALQSRQYEKDGQRHTVYEVNVTDYWYVDSRDMDKQSPPPVAIPELRPNDEHALPFDL